MAVWALRFSGGGEMARSLSAAGRFLPEGDGSGTFAGAIVEILKCPKGSRKKQTEVRCSGERASAWMLTGGKGRAATWTRRGTKARDSLIACRCLEWVCV